MSVVHSLPHHKSSPHNVNTKDVNRESLVPSIQEREPALDGEYVYVDTAMGGVHNRNTVMKLSDFNPVAGVPDCFTTYLRFTEDLLDYTHSNLSATTGKPSVAGYPGPALAEFLPFDFDDKKDPGRALAEAAHFVKFWEKKYGFPPEALRIFWSGMKGVSIEVPADLFGGFEPSVDIAQRLEVLAAKMTPGAKTLDTTIYEKMRLWRVPNTRHGSSGLYKVPLPPGALLKLEELLNV